MHGTTIHHDARHRAGDWRTALMAVATAATLATCNVGCAAAKPSAGPAGIPFGKTPEGADVHLHTLAAGGRTAKISTLGATLVELHVPDRAGKLADVVLGFDKADTYRTDANQYFGCTTGRVCNRIAKGRFTLDGKTYELAVNNGPNHLHGGVKTSLDKLVWTATPVPVDGGQALKLTVSSPDGDEGYPGKLDVTVTYTLTDKGELRIDYAAVTDKVGPVNLTNHAYFNLGGAGTATVLDHELTLFAAKFTPTDDTLIPTGRIEPVSGSPLDFTKPAVLRQRVEKLADTPAKGIDHNFVLDSGGGKLAKAAVLRDPGTGRVMTVWTDQPGIQVYTGNFLKGQTGKGGKTYAHRSAMCLETQHFPDSVNQPSFPSTILKPGATYRTTTVYAFSAD